jgi:hypothetical protein
LSDSNSFLRRRYGLLALPSEEEENDDDDEVKGFEVTGPGRERELFGTMSGWRLKLMT